MIRTKYFLIWLANHLTIGIRTYSGQVWRKQVQLHKTHPVLSFLCDTSIFIALWLVSVCVLLIVLTNANVNVGMFTTLNGYSRNILFIAWGIYTFVMFIMSRYSIFVDEQDKLMATLSKNTYKDYDDSE